MRFTRTAAGAALTVAALSTAQLLTAAPAAADPAYASVTSQGRELRMLCQERQDAPGTGGTSGTRSDFDGNGFEDVLTGARDEHTGGRIAVVLLQKVTTIGVVSCVFYGTTLADSVAAYTSGDLDNDGFDDLVLGQPGQHDAAGGIWVVPGAPAGFDLAAGVYLDEDTDAFPGVRNPGDELGATLASGDVNHDGYADLAVASPGESFGVTDAGAVAVLYGSASGLTTTGSQRFHTALAGIPGDPVAPGERFGRALAVGDVTGDGYGDLAVGSGAAGGQIFLLDGSATGITTVGADLVESSFLNTGTLIVHGFGDRVTIGDVTGDSRADVIAGMPDADVKGLAGAGAAIVLPGRASGIGLADRQVLRQGAAGIPGTPAAGDHFGYAVATGDTTGDGHPDLIIGVPGEDIDVRSDAGIVDVLPHNSVLGTGSSYLSKSTLAVGSMAADAFGSWLTVLDRVNNGGQLDLTVSEPGANIPSISPTGGVQMLVGVVGEQRPNVGYGGWLITTPAEMQLRNFGIA
ncbi:FG-GAP repeat protein [Catellatospora sp. KI3]|uniref:FG-GAP repeat protein n=1 Tax=Catellatospora sp. KI3 TaxID=3041620 RepID=UPI00248317FF|nr:FG-GAP repeat protein [Catellatospora sp. KI3]MDI1462918.1 FG-GAP repeat protein [Catellatospora sp. KI3]